MIYAFGDCTLNVVLYELRRNGEVLHVEPQVFDVLLYLLRHRLEVVSRDELLEAVWGDGFVTEATLNSRIMAVRKAIGDDGRTQQLIKTVRGRGFRFVGAVEERDELPAPHNERTGAAEAAESPASIELSPPATPPALNTPPAFGRATEMRHLRQRLNLSLAGKRQLIFLTGEAGIGKTTLLQTFLTEAKNQSEFWVLTGQCLDQHGVGEPYMPLLSALGQLCREPQGDRVTALLMQCAPTWLVQMPSLVGAAELELLQQRTLGATRERMLREMVEALETMSAERALLLVLEDLHWSDHATLDLLSWLARRPEAARLMMIGTYRPADAAAGGHPLRALAQELRIRGYCAELALSSLSDEAISEYLQARFPGMEDVHQLAAVVHRRTGGNPLFMHHIVEAWCDAGHLSLAESGWKLHATADELTAGIPDNIRQLIEQQIQGLQPCDQRILEAASVAGAEFCAAAISSDAASSDAASSALVSVNAITGAPAGDNMSLLSVERRCVELARQGLFLLPHGTAQWPDGTLCEQFHFSHHLYQEVLYERIPASQRAQLHRQIGERLEQSHGAQAATIAPELAMHFMQGREPVRAVHYLQQAAEQALKCNAYREAVEHLCNALDVLRQHTEFPQRAQREWELQSALAPALIAINGWMTPEVEQAYHRARVLSEQLGEPVALASAIYGLATLYEVRGDYEKAQQLLEERLHLLQEVDRKVVQAEKPLLESHELMACSLYHQGLFERAWQHADEGLKYYDPSWYSETLASIGENAGVGCQAWGALALWFAGYPDQALTRMQSALDIAQLPYHDYSLASATTQMAVLHQLRGEVENVERYADTTLQLAGAGGFPYRVATGRILRGWTLAAQGKHEEGIHFLRKGLKVCHSMGALYDYPYFLALLAQACGWAGQLKEAFDAIDEAGATIQKCRHFYFNPELQRLRGELMLQADECNEAEAEALFQQAFDMAHTFEAKSLELRAATSLCRLWQKQGRIEAAQEQLAPIYNSFSEGLATADLQRAATLLHALEHGSRSIEHNSARIQLTR